MNFLRFSAALVCTGMMLSPARSSADSTPAPVGPKLVFATNQYHFGRVPAGTVVKYVFNVTNTGDQTLEIINVAPGCHCTTAGDWTHKIAPGETGKIPIQFDSGVFHGPVTKTILVTSNDKLAPRQNISLEGVIWRALEITPQFAYMTVPPDASSNVTSVVHISNEADEPLVLAEPVSANHSFTATLKTNKPGKDFEVTITAVPPFPPGNTSGSVSIKTSSTNLPVINITTLAAVQPAVSVMPMQIVLPPRVDNWVTNRVSLVANGKNPLKLSDPTICCDKAARVDLVTLTPGRIYQLVVAFPPGFQVAPGQQPWQVTVKSDNASQPVITVPIMQSPRQTFAPPPPQHPRVMSQVVTTPPVSVHP